jgi:Holliday junction resolvase RusA-like endonuclease
MRHFCLLLPFPISTNSLYANIRGRGRIKTKRYKEWVQEAYLMSCKQDLQFFQNRVDIIIHLGGGRKNSDCSNMIKGIEDFLVNQKIIFDDSKPYVRSVKAIWDEDVTGAMIEISEIEK